MKLTYLFSLSILLFLVGCEEGKTLDLKQVCVQTVKVCSLADNICALDPKIAEHETCLKRKDVCGPAVALCSVVNASEAPQVPVELPVELVVAE